MLSELPQYQVLFRLADDKPWRAEDGRALLGQLFKGDPSESIATLFHHHTDGSLVSAMPTIRFRGGQGFFGIVAIGEKAVDTLQSIDHVLRRRLSEHLGRPIRAELSDTNVSVSLAERMRSYRAHMVVFARKHRAMKTVFEAPDDQLQMHLRRMVIRDIRTQAETLGLELPAEQFPFQIVDVGRRSRIPLNKEGQRLYVGAVKYIDIVTTLDFKGHWALGGLQNRGFGGLRLKPPAMRANPPVIPATGDLYAQL